MTVTELSPLTPGLLGDIAAVTMGQSPVGTSYNRDRIGIPLINGPTEFTRRCPVAKQWTTAPVRFCKPGDVLICVRGSSTGRMNIADSRYCIGRGVAAVRARGENDQGFISYALSSVVDELLKLQTGSTFPSIDSRVIKGGEILIPHPTEQRAIAHALHHADEFIAALEQLITKKQAMKQGMMQRLLTGRVRLPGFSEPWAKAKLREVGTFLKGRGVKREDVRRNGVPCIRYGELYTEFKDYTSKTRSFVEPTVAATSLPIRAGDLLFAGSGETREEIGICVAYTGVATAVAGGDIIVLRGLNFNPVYLALLTNTPTVAAQKAKHGQGDAVVHISSRALGNIELFLPPRPEQDAIAAVLADSDDEIRVLQNRLTKARDIKQGFMQELLTGRIRLSATGTQHE
ncbi:MAG: restriction endonuclease subunit S [Pseudonocardiaceae bacterium]